MSSNDDVEFGVEECVQIPASMSVAPAFAQGETVEIVDELGGAFEIVLADDGVQDQNGFIASDDLQDSEATVVVSSSEDSEGDDVSDASVESLGGDEQINVLVIGDTQTVHDWSDGGKVPAEKFSQFASAMRRSVSKMVGQIEVDADQIQLGVVNTRDGREGVMVEGRDGMREVERRSFGTLMKEWHSLRTFDHLPEGVSVPKMRRFEVNWDLFEQALSVPEQIADKSEVEVKKAIQNYSREKKQASMDRIRDSTPDGTSVLGSYDTFEDLAYGTNERNNLDDEKTPVKWGKAYEHRRKRACEWADLVFNFTPDANANYFRSIEGKADTRRAKFGEGWEDDARHASDECLYADINDGLASDGHEEPTMNQWQPDPAEQVMGEMDPDRARKVATEGSATYGDGDSENDFERTKDTFDPTAVTVDR